MIRIEAFKALHRYSGEEYAQRFKRTACITICLVLCALTFEMHGQVIRGVIYENVTHNPISDAEIFIASDQHTEQLHSDIHGAFSYQPSHAGRFDIIVSHLNYELVHLQALELSSTKDLILEIPLTARITELTEVSIMAPSVRRINNRFFTVTEEETRRFPATFFDPARTATLFPGVFAANDQANGLVINGLSPSMMQWYLEDVPILNPNHLANAGTLSDRATTTGGGVNMLSNQVLSTSTLATGALAPRYGDAVSGVLDMRFRNGNYRKPEHTVQAGLLGIDLTTEGRLSAESKASYLVNYRYSTVGLLSAIGVDLGDEKINFQDLNFNVQFPFGARDGFVKIFGVAGLNKNDLDGPKPMEEQQDSRDISNITYDAGTVIAGAALQYPTQKGMMKATIALSYAKSDRNERRQGNEGLAYYSNELAKQTKISSRIEWLGQRSNRVTVNGGLLLTNDWVNTSGYYPQSDLFVIDGSLMLLRPYARVSYVVTGDIVVRGGIGLAFVAKGGGDSMGNKGKLVPEPSAHIYWQAGDKVAIESGYSYSGMITPQVTLRKGSQLPLDLLRAHVFSFIFRNQLRSSTQIAGIINYYALAHVPADTLHKSGQTILGGSEYPQPGPLVSKGKGRTISLGLALRQDVQRGTFVRAGIGWIHATHQGTSGLLQSTAYDTGPWALLSGGKEWATEKDFGDRVLGVNGGIQWRRGMHDQEIDLEDSRDAGYTVYVDEGNFSVQLEDYFRIDLRVYLRKTKVNKTTTWSLDIQNVTSRENPFFSLYDSFQDAIRQTTQLGIIPVLSYRVDF